MRTLFRLTLVVALVLACNKVLQRRHDAAVEALHRNSYFVTVEALRGRLGKKFLRVVSTRNGEPVPDVVVNLTLIGPDGGSGGYQQFLTDANGYAHLYHSQRPGRYQYDLMNVSHGKLYRTDWRRGDPYVTLNRAGRCQPQTLVLRQEEPSE